MRGRNLILLILALGVGGFLLWIAMKDDGSTRAITSASGPSSAPLTLQIRSTGTFQADYTNGGYSFHVNFTWDESRPVALEYRDREYVSSSPGAGTLIASGSARSSGTKGGPNDSCGFNAAPSPTLKILVNFGRTSPTDQSRTVHLQAQAPFVTNANGTTDGQLTTFGTCSTTSIGGVAPYLHQHPLGGSYDPGASCRRRRPERPTMSTSIS